MVWPEIGVHSARNPPQLRPRSARIPPVLHPIWAKILLVPQKQRVRNNFPIQVKLAAGYRLH